MTSSWHHCDLIVTSSWPHSDIISSCDIPWQCFSFHSEQLQLGKENSLTEVCLFGNTWKNPVWYLINSAFKKGGNPYEPMLLNFSWCHCITGLVRWRAWFKREQSCLYVRQDFFRIFLTISVRKVRYCSFFSQKYSDKSGLKYEDIWEFDGI